MKLTCIYNNRFCKIRIRTTAAFIGLLYATLFISCEKTNNPGNPTPVQLFNALDGDMALRVNMSGTHPIRYSAALVLPNKFYLLKDNVVYVNSFPQVMDLYSSKDTLLSDSPVLRTTINLDRGAIYSMFVYGSPAKPGYILNKDIIPDLNSIDSVTYIRFVNLSEGQDISVNLKAKPDGSFINSLSFEQISGFIELKADKSVGSYEFEVRDKTTGNLITSYIADGINDYSLSNRWYNRSNTLVFTGKKNGTDFNLQKVVLMNNR